MGRAILILFFCGIIFSCEDLIEVEDISNESVSVLAPVNNSVVSDSVINFSWQPIEYADSYQLQVAQPSFENAILIVEDTTITTTNFSKTLENGNYQWRIKAINFAYETQYSTQNLTIED